MTSAPNDKSTFFFFFEKVMISVLNRFQKKKKNIYIYI